MLDQPLPPGIDADVRLLLGSSHVRRHEGGPALDHLRRARAFFEEMDDQLMTVEALDWEATALYLIDDPSALTKSVEALERCERLRPSPPALQVRILIHRAGITYHRGDWRSTVRLYERGLELSKIEPNVRHRAMMHDGLSAAYQQLGRFPAAVDEARRAFTLYQMDRDERSLFRIEANLGYLLVQQGELAAAAPHLDRALELCDERGLERWGRSHVLCSLAELHIAKDELDQAERYLREAHEVARKHDERRQQAMALRLSGRLHLKRGDDAAADRAFADAIAIFSELEMPEYLRDCHIEYAEALQARGLLELSIVHWRAAAEAGRQSAAASSAEGASLVGDLGA
jgi:tetratricopeptide (TPR) repeat protein